MMANLDLSGPLNLMGNLTLKGASGGKVTIGGVEILVEVPPGNMPAQGSAPPVMMPPPPAGPSDPGLFVNVINSFNKTVMVGSKPAVALGMVMQGNVPTWPGMVLPSQGNTAPVTANGIPINVVPQGEPMVGVTFDSYPDESDPGPYPLPDPSVAKVEGGTPEVCDGDCHFLVVESGACTLFEGYACSHQTDGWHCGNGARWDLTKNSYGQRPKGWTSADAAGLPILPGLVRLPEVRAGEITHAFRFTVECTRDNFVKPATHRAVPGSCDPTDANSPPMGLRVRLSRDYDVSGLSAPAQVVARAMKKYGMIIADNGSNFYFQGEDDPGWTDTDVEPLKKIPASAFEVIAPPPLER